MKINNDEVQKIKNNELPKYVVQLINREPSIAVPNSYILTLLEARVNYQKYLKALNLSIPLIRITVGKLLVDKLKKRIGENSKNLYDYLMSSSEWLKKIYSDYISPTITVVNIDRVNKIHDLISKDIEKFNNLIDGMYCKSKEWKSVKDEYKKMADNVSKKFKEDTKEIGNFSDEFGCQIVNAVSWILIEAKKIRCCELKIKKGREEILDNVSPIMEKLSDVKHKLKFINQHCTESLSNPKFKRYRSSLSAIIDRISSFEKNIIISEVDQALKSAKYSTANATNIMNAKSALKTMVQMGNKIFDNMKDPLADINNNRTSIKDFWSCFERQKKCIGDIILKINIKKNSSDNVQDITDKLNNAGQKLDSFLKDKTITELDKINKMANKSAIWVWICSHANMILQALGFLTAIII